MADIIDFGKYANEGTDIDSMDKASLLSYLKTLQAQIAELDAAEPKNMNSEAFEEWGDLHEELEDLVVDVLDRLDEMV